MAKRGERRPWKVVQHWPHFDRPVVTSHASRHEAEAIAENRRRLVSPVSGEADCVVEVVYLP